jgi:hypothetical protein
MAKSSQLGLKILFETKIDSSFYNTDVANVQMLMKAG